MDRTCQAQSPDGRSKRSGELVFAATTRLKFGTATPRVRRMKNGKNAKCKRPSARVELGRFIVADPEVCHGKPTFKGTRIMVWQILDELVHGMTPHLNQLSPPLPIEKNSQACRCIMAK